MDLTKNEFEEILDQKFNKQTKILLDQIEELARMTKGGFDDVLERLDVKERVQALEKQMAEMRIALHLN